MYFNCTYLDAVRNYVDNKSPLVVHSYGFKVSAL